MEKLYTKQKQLEKGVAFPVCISVNDIVCNHSPLASEELVSNVTERRNATVTALFQCLFKSRGTHLQQSSSLVTPYTMAHRTLSRTAMS